MDHLDSLRSKRRGDGASGSLKSPKSVLCLCVLGFGKKKQHEKCSWSSWSCPPSRFALIYASCKPSALGKVRVFPSPRASSKRSTLKKTKKQTTNKQHQKTKIGQKPRGKLRGCPLGSALLLHDGLGSFQLFFSATFPPPPLQVLLRCLRAQRCGSCCLRDGNHSAESSEKHRERKMLCFTFS